MITRDDVMIALSYSGENDELLTIVPLVKRQGGRLIAITGNALSSLAKEADVHLMPASMKRPVRSTWRRRPVQRRRSRSAMLAVALLEARGFGEEDFARSHPGGSLGRRLLTRVSDVMRTGDAIPRGPYNASLSEALL
jgi:arabinose-5-phosphate isomerase